MAEGAGTEGENRGRRRIPGDDLLDELTEQLERTRQLLTHSPEAAAEAALERFAGESEEEARIARDLAAAGPLAVPGRLLEAHRLVMRALEVLDREGARNVRVSRWFGPLRPLAEFGAEFVASYIVKAYAQDVAGSLRRLYARREAQSLPGSPERAGLARARVEADRLAPGFSGGGIGAPVLVAGGAAVPLAASVGQYLGAIDFLSRPVIGVGFGALFLLFLFLSSVLLSGAGLAHRRSRLIMSQPLAALWEVVGHAGEPPSDNSRMFATVAIVLTGLVWVVIPVAGVVLYLVS
ncbi:MAG: hypothetical protein KJ048_17995 [Dehalococcoidia bacterium]|nr:hypothetical protein [Dehalococcoidia bacterium]